MNELAHVRNRARLNGDHLPSRARLVLADSDSTRAAQTARQLEQLGWEVHLAVSGSEARRLNRTLKPGIVVVAVDLPDESGWLTAAKLTHEHPEGKVVLIGVPDWGERSRYARFVGAVALVDGIAAIQSLLSEIVGLPRRAVG